MFIHLRVYSEYSISQGILTVGDLIDKALEHDMPAIALTDLNNLFALVKFYVSAVRAGIQPIIGCDLTIRSEQPYPCTSRIVVLAKDQQGYKNLIKLISILHIQQVVDVGIDKDYFISMSDGLIVLSGGMDGDIAQALKAAKTDELAQRCIDYWKKHLGDRFYCEVSRLGFEGEEEYIQSIVSLSDKFQVPLVATNLICFREPNHFEAHEARVCIHGGYVLGDSRRKVKYSADQYFKSPAQMEACFHDIPEAILNTYEIAQRCRVNVALGTYHLPVYPIPEDQRIEEFFENVSREGMCERLVQLYGDAFLEDKKFEVYEERLKTELDIICRMKFPGYFLIVMDFVSWAKQHAIPVGPGRGSGAGSLVAFALRITDVDPIKYDLLFERFLNPERVSMPDFDIDFCMDGRDRVIEYVASRYGKSSVSQIITFNTMAAKAVVRDVARVQGKPYDLADRVSKLIPFEIGITLEKAMEEGSELEQFVSSNAEAAEIMDMAYALEGLVRNVGKHAGGVVIAPADLSEYVPVYLDEAGVVLTQLDKDDVESAGLVKFDFLGLKTLTVLDKALGHVNAARAKEEKLPIDLAKIALDYAPAYKQMREGNTTAVFQLESRGMKELIMKLKPDDIEDVMALVALFRPGPLQSGMVEDFIERKHGKADIVYLHPDLEQMLNNTYGIIVYQEQVMTIAQVLAGYTLGEADLLRRAMGKKKPAEMEKQRDKFLKGCDHRSIDLDIATHVFDLMEKFAGYGFNKSHTASYALVSYQTVWLKTIYPASFMAAALSAEMQNHDKILILVEECKRMGLEVVLPSINRSVFNFMPQKEDAVIYGLGAIKGLGQAVIELCVENRLKSGSFSSLLDFCKRLSSGKEKLRQKTIETLIYSGAMDCLIGDASSDLETSQIRGDLLHQLPKVLQIAQQYSENKSKGMVSLFGDDLAEEEILPSVDMGEGRPLDTYLTHEKSVLGLYLTAHPMTAYWPELAKARVLKLAKLWHGGLASGICAGLIIDVRVKQSSSGNIAFFTLDDSFQRYEMAIFSDAYAMYRAHVKKDVLVVVQGDFKEVGMNRERRFQVKALFSFDEMRAKYGTLILTIKSTDKLNATLKTLRELLENYKGNCVVEVMFQTLDSISGVVRFGKQWSVLPSDALLSDLRELLGGVENVRIVYR